MDAVIKKWPREQHPDHVRATPAPVENRPSREEAEAAVRALIAYLGDDPSREGLAATPKRVVAALGRALPRLSRSPRRCALPHFRRDRSLRRFRADPRHRFYLALRAPHDGVPRQGACRLPAGRARRRFVETGPPGRRLCAPAANAGASDLANRGRHRRSIKAARRRGAARGRAHLHVDPRRRQARRLDRDDAVSGKFPRHQAKTRCVS